ncbi:hypothetical protein RN001_003761 [Aquatica leii]|uniref:Regulatory protein zeste n=1 Tax=Aquatica leii TaxID=1421715 RepID=A0AAN7ST32_9COLE|nr:hypothetical protein RN001_003761 [Aquatica leii]
MENKKRCPNFTSDEKIKLLKLIESQRDIILNKKTDGVTNKAKEEAWLRITANFNATSNTIRPTDSFKKMWNTFKSTAKTYRSKQRISITQTGGGPEDIKTDPVLEEVLRFMGRCGVGLSCGNDSDIVIGGPNESSNATGNINVNSDTRSQVVHAEQNNVDDGVDSEEGPFADNSDNDPDYVAEPSNHSSEDAYLNSQNQVIIIWKQWLKLKPGDYDAIAFNNEDKDEEDQDQESEDGEDEDEESEVEETGSGMTAKDGTQWAATPQANIKSWEA